MDWFFYSVIALIALGTSMSLYKMPTFKGYSSFHSTFWTNVFSLGITSIVLVIFSSSLLSIATISWYGLLWGVFFATTMVQQKILLKRMETNTLLPVTSALGSVCTVLTGLILLSESISLLQTFGILFVLVSVFLFTRKTGSYPIDINSVTLSTGIILSSTISKYLQKLGAMTLFTILLFIRILVQ
jgi:multidrug transporter EmrE-like cation transporter